MTTREYGQVLGGNEDVLQRSWDAFSEIEVDEIVPPPETPPPREETTLSDGFSVTGPGTFFGSAQRRLTFEPTDMGGWWFDRLDHPRTMPIHVTVENVWTTVRNIVLCSGSPHNYMRMVEHIIALKLGMGLDSVIIRQDSGDPPVFDRSSLDLVEGVERVGVRSIGRPATYVAVKEPVSMVSKSGRFLVLLPPEDGDRHLHIDCALDFPSAIGKQRIKFTVTPETFRRGAYARTNTTFLMMLYVKTIGQLFADTRNLGYTRQNILVAGRHRYFNSPRLLHRGKALEAVWHRAALDLVAALALIDRGRLAGTVLSYKAGHRLDVDMVRALYRGELLSEMG